MRPPSVDRLARSLADTGLPHPILVDVARGAIADGVPDDAGRRAHVIARSLLQPVVNATGIVLHTNLGRAPLQHHQDARATNLEFDLGTGTRGSRHRHAGDLLAKACGAEAAIVVNNCAGAMLLVVAALASERGVAVARGEAVEIGGGFRIPEVMEQSGARLIDVGTTNRTRLADYQRAIDRFDVAMTLKVHPSNYRVEGFTESTSTKDLAALAVPLVVDLGSGLLDARCPWLPNGPPSWLAGEPAARQELEAGAGLVVFSGDKLLSGPQAGIIAGRADLVARCAAHPLARALRAGGLVLAALQTTAMAYLARDLGPLWFWRAATTPVAELRRRAEAIVAATTAAITATTADANSQRFAITVVDTEAAPGAGCAPGTVIASVGLRIDGDISFNLRNYAIAIIGRVRDDATWLDLRSVDPSDDATLVAALTQQLQSA
jgi:L-seryl-tRNA(Ser) seleniumtransferase